MKKLFLITFITMGLNGASAEEAPVEQAQESAGSGVAEKATAETSAGNRVQYVAHECKNDSILDSLDKALTQEVTL